MINEGNGAAYWCGRKVKDRITGFAGSAVGYVQYISGCNQVLIAPPLGADGKLPDSLWFDEQRLEFTDQESDRVVLNNDKTPGFDKAPPRRP